MAQTRRSSKYRADSLLKMTHASTTVLLFLIRGGASQGTFTFLSCTSFRKWAAGAVHCRNTSGTQKEHLPQEAIGILNTWRGSNACGECTAGIQKKPKDMSHMHAVSRSADLLHEINETHCNSVFWRCDLNSLSCAILAEQVFHRCGLCVQQSWKMLTSPGTQQYH